jgi:WXG100 family type VII secretion target
VVVHVALVAHRVRSHRANDDVLGPKEVAVTVTPEEFEVDLQAFATAISTVSKDRDSVRGHSATLKGIFVEVQSIWDGPAGNTFDSLKPAFDKALDALNTLLDDLVIRMQQTYDNYVAVEDANSKNFP